MEPVDRFVRAEWHVDFGGRGRLETELEPSRVWVALPEHLGAEVWIKSVTGTYDFRLTLRRSEDGFEVMLDRGPTVGASWPDESPKMGIKIDGSAQAGVVYLRLADGMEIWHQRFVP